MENNLKDRYIYAVTRHLPTKIQSDVEQELDSLISEMADERRGNNAIPNEQDIKDVLAELGKPEELALKYYGSEQKSLISGVHFLMYKRVLSTVLPIIAAVLAVLTTMGLFINDETLRISLNIGNANMSRLVQVITTTIGGIIQAFAVITIIFAILEYLKVDFKDSDYLPEIPEAKLKVSPWNPIVGIAFSISTTVLFLGFPQVIGMISASTDFNWIQVFDTGVIRSMWLPIILWTVLEIGAEIVKLVEGQYTIRLAAVTIVANIIGVLCAITVFGNNEILNPEFLNSVGRSHYINFEAVGWIFNNMNLILMIVVLFVLLFETLDVVVKAFQSKRV